MGRIKRQDNNLRKKVKNKGEYTHIWKNIPERRKGKNNDTGLWKTSRSWKFTLYIYFVFYEQSSVERSWQVHEMVDWLWLPYGDSKKVNHWEVEGRIA